MMKSKRIALVLVSILTFGTVGTASWIITNNITTGEIGHQDNNVTEVKTRKVNLYDGQSLIKPIEVDDGDVLVDYIKSDPKKQGYYFDGWFANSSCTTRIDEGMHVTSDLNIYAKYIKKDPSSIHQIVPNQSGTTTIVPPAAGSSQQSVIESEKITSNTTLDIKHTPDPNVASKDTKHPTDGNNASGITKFPSKENAKNIVKLENDLTIETGATLNIGAKLGFTSASGANQQYNGAISGDFTALDLNGHNLIVKGTLNACGLICNSRPSKGLVYVDTGGIVMTAFVVLDFKGGGITTTTYSHCISPFTEYIMPYFDTTLIMKGGSILNCGASLCAQGKNYYTEINMTGSTSNNNCFLQYDEGYLVKFSSLNNKEELTPYEFLTKNTTNSLKPSLYREHFEFHKNLDLSKITLPDSITYTENTNASNCKLNTNILRLSLAGTAAEMDYVEFPITSFVDLKFFGFDVNIKQPYDCMPYSNIYFDKNSKLIFTHSDKQNVVGSITTRDSLDYHLQTEYLHSMDGFIADMKSDHAKSIVTVDGKIEIQPNSYNNNTILGSYRMGGYINLSPQALKTVLDNANKIKLAGASVFFVGDGGKGTYRLAANRYYGLPLITNGDAYINGPNGTYLKGKYDSSNGTVAVNNKLYSFIFSSNDLTPLNMTNLKLGKIQEILNDRLSNVSGDWIESTYNSSTGVLHNSKGYYVFYNGANIKVNSDSVKTNVITRKEFIWGLIGNHYLWKFVKIHTNGDIVESTTLNFDSANKLWKPVY